MLGGTFDHLHNGHKKLLMAAVSICKECLIIGVVASDLLRSKGYAYLIQLIDERKQNVIAYIKAIRPDLQLHIETIHDPFGPSIVVDQIGAIVVSSETIPGALKINQLRKQKQLNECQIYVLRRSNCSTLSSTFLRQYLTNH